MSEEIALNELTMAEAENNAAAARSAETNAKLVELGLTGGGGGGESVDIEPWRVGWEADRASIVELEIPIGVTKIGEGAFKGCGDLERLTIPNGVITIGNHAFYQCDSINSITIADDVEIIGNWAFQICPNLLSLKLPSNKTKNTVIGDYAFGYCNTLQTLIIPEGVSIIGGYAFQYCFALTTLELPSSLYGIRKGAFEGCPASCNIKFNKSMDEVSAMVNYPWGITSGAVIKCTDGDLTV
jgi:hypothetical protein